jgi:hypothetical protein
MISTLADHGGDISWIGSLFIRYYCLISLTDRSFDGMMIHAACADHHCNAADDGSFLHFIHKSLAGDVDLLYLPALRLADMSLYALFGYYCRPAPGHWLLFSSGFLTG